MSAQTIDITLALPRQLVHKLERAARAQRASVADVVAGTLDHILPAAADLPPTLLAELLAMVDLSDAALQEVAAARLTASDDQRLRELDEQARVRPLADGEVAEHEALLNRWQEAVIRRAQAMLLLQRRGFDVPADGNGSTSASR